jgi:hypothetical protein
VIVVHLLERDHQLRCLRRVWDDALGGSGSIVLLAGESGIGKTRLARVFVDGLDHGQVLWGVCDPLGVPRPLGPLHDVAADLGDPLARLLADGAPLYEISGELLSLLKARSVLLVVDDLQWADEATVDLLRFLLRRLPGTRSLVLATYRADDLDHQHALRGLLGDVARAPGATRLDLAPLSVEAVTTIVGARDIDPTRLHRLTRGNSFFVTEIVSQDGEALPTTVRDAVLARAAGLDTAARDLAELVACAPTGIPDVLLPALGVGSGPLRTLDAAGLIARERRGITYRHDICRLAVADAIPPGGDVALHRRMLAAFETQPDSDPAVMVHHALAAGDAERVFSYAGRAGRVAAGSGAHTEAVRFFRTALDAVTNAPSAPAPSWLSCSPSSFTSPTGSARRSPPAAERSRCVGRRATPAASAPAAGCWPCSSGASATGAAPRSMRPQPSKPSRPSRTLARRRRRRSGTPTRSRRSWPCG